MDEAWFYLVSCAIEAAGAPSLPAIVDCMHAVSRGDISAVTRNLKIILDVVQTITAVLLRMYDGCDPHIFYFRVRKFVAAWAGNPLLPDGLLYQGVDESDVPEYEIDGSVEKDLEGFSREFRLQREELDWSISAGACKWEDEEINVGFAGDAASEVRQGPGIRQSTTSSHERPSNIRPFPPPRPGVRRKFAGGSAAQSPIIQALDIALGVQHKPQFAALKRRGSGVVAEEQQQAGFASSTSNAISLSRTPSTSADPSHRSPHTFESTVPKNFIHEMRAYLPGPHRSFLLALSRAPAIRAFVTAAKESNPDGADVVEMAEIFNKCVDGMKKFRDKHVQMVSVYILVQGKKRRAEDGVVEAGGAGVGSVAGESKGTGGTNILPFLRQSREETKAAQV
ncbi:hypothetical protein HDU93_000285 [Gonapodya sp. JEL0774]|nr:hypothetical protein HDU93_000285 [Gonapodya sp. JEL0774]